ncbi:MAG TPA: hypothetical protein VFQ85_08425 [Mycobacteriales bacterium]|jgi:hypothetical protein|nr:hypothetical protein [Mycobacteriales bacterium]
MTKPQQNELRRSGKGATDQSSAELKPEAGQELSTKGRGGPVPPANEPGWVGRTGPAKNYPDK